MNPRFLSILSRQTSLSRTGAAVAIGVTLFFAACSIPSTTRRGPEWHQVRIGLCEDYPEETRTLAAARRDLAFARDSGAKVLRIAFGWDATEPEQGKFDWSFWDDFVASAYSEYHVELIPYVCYTPRWAATDTGENYWRSPPRDVAEFARFVEALVSRYRIHIHTWEIWNEPDNSSYWLGTREGYAELLKAGSAAVRRADPSAKVVLGGIATDLDFLESLFRLDDVAPAVDVVNVHSYLETWHPDSIEHLTPMIQRVAQIVRDFGEHEAVWLAEMGYSSVGNRAATSDYYRPHFADEHSEVAQARAVIRMITLAACSTDVATVAWYRIHDLPPAETVIGDDNNRHLGLLSANGTEKPAAKVFDRLAPIFSSAFRVLPVQIVSGATHPIEAHLIETADGKAMLFVWSAMPGSAAPAQPEHPDTRRERVVLRLPPSVETARLQPVSWAPDKVDSIDVSPGKDRGEIAVNLRGSEVAVFETRLH